MANQKNKSFIRTQMEFTVILVLVYAIWGFFFENKSFSHTLLFVIVLTAGLFIFFFLVDLLYIRKKN